MVFHNYYVITALPIAYHTYVLFILHPCIIMIGSSPQKTLLKKQNNKLYNNTRKQR